MKRTDQSTSTSPVVQAEQWYDHPYYYDLGFQDETEQEACFLRSVLERFGRPGARRILEAGCGTGRLVIRLAELGYEVAGFDLNQRALDFLHDRLQSKGLEAEFFQADMASFRVSRKFDMVINPLNTFRHLLTEQEALGHLQSAVAALKEGGLFVLGMHIMPHDADMECIERWRASEGSTKVSYTLRVLSWDRKRRIERLRISMLIRRAAEREQRVRAEMDLRTYNLSQLRSLLAKVPELQLVDSFDFWYEINEPIPLSRTVADIVLVMRKVRKR